MSVSRHIALFSTSHCLDKIELTFLIEIAAFSKCRICVQAHVSQILPFSNSVFLKFCFSQILRFSNPTILKSCILKFCFSQILQFSSFAILKFCISQILHFSNSAILKFCDFGSPPFAIFQHPKNREIWHSDVLYLVGFITYKNCLFHSVAVALDCYFIKKV